MAEFTAITTQEEFDARIKDRMERFAKKFEGFVSPDEVEKIRNDYDSQITALNKSAEDNAKKYSNFEKQLKERDEKISAYENDSTKTRIAHEKGLPYESIAFLQGSDEESISKSADALKAMLGSNRPASPSKSSEPTDIDSKSVSMKKLLNGLKGE